MQGRCTQARGQCGSQMLVGAVETAVGTPAQSKHVPLQQQLGLQDMATKHVLCTAARRQRNNYHFVSPGQYNCTQRGMAEARQSLAR